MNLLTRLGALALLSAPSAAWAQAAPDLNARLAAMEAATKSAQSAGDNAWMLVCAALVLMMTAPGLALFYGGLVRRKNVLGTMMHSFILMAVVTVIWAVVGYSLAFGGSSPYLGDFQFAFLNGVGAAPNADYAGTIPHSTFMVYQLMFAIITPALISGAFAERMKFSAMLLFTVLWTPRGLLPHGAHGVGQGRPAQRVFRRPDSLLRFRRRHGGAHHLRRVGAGLRHLSRQAHRLPAVPPSKPHNLVISIIGAAMLWVGWFGFNAGSALAANGLATSAFVATHFAAAAATLAWMAVEWIEAGKPSMLGAISGCVAGLVAITPASGFVKPFPAMLIGACAGVMCYFMVTRVKRRFAYDDALDAFGVHGAGGTLGALLTGVFATSAINDGLKDAAGKVQPLGLVDGNAGQVLNQLGGTAIAWGLAIVGTLVILKIVDATVGLRVTKQQESDGLDLSMHNEEGYVFEN